MTEPHTDPDAETLSDEDRAQARQRLALTLRAAAFGELVALLMRSTSHRNMPLHELSTLVAPALLLDQYLAAKKKTEEGDASMLVGVAMWAKVSDEIDAKIRANPAAPIRLQMAEWNSGPHHWLVDMIAITPARGALLRDMQKRVGEDVAINIRSKTPDGQPAVVTLAEMIAASAAAKAAGGQA